jgi:hypothetical protein
VLSLPALAYWTGVLAVVFTALGATFGVGSWYLSRREGETKDIEIARFQAESKVAIAAADARAAEANVKAAELNSRAAQAELQLRELQERARPRTIDPDVRETLVMNLRLGSHAPIEISFVSGSAIEPLEYAVQLRSALEDGGWTVTKSTGGAYMGRVPTGLIIAMPDDVSLQTEAENLRIALSLSAIEARVVRDARVKTEHGTLHLIVGVKP